MPNAKKFAKMLRMRVIKLSDSDFASPGVLVRKPDGSFRFYVDFIKDNFPMPLIQEKLDNLGGYKVSTAGALFLKAIDKILNGIKNASAYIDDLMVFRHSRSTWLI